VLVIALSEALSATHQSAMLAKDAVAAKIPVRVVDSKAVSMAQGLLAVEIAELAKTGASLDELEKKALELTDKVGVVAMLDTLEHLQKGGRVGGAKALMGQVLSIKPLLELKDGIVSEAGRQRTKAKALAAIADVARNNAPLRRLALVHGASDEVEALTKLVSDIPTEFPLVVTDIGPVVGTHGGPGIIGLCWVQA
jgi:DegV family protein with EDD domain